MTFASSPANRGSRPSRRTALTVAAATGAFVALGLSAPWLAGALTKLEGGPLNGPTLRGTTLHDEQGSPTRFPADGTPTVAAFLYTSCPDVCPLAFAVLVGAATDPGVSYAAVTVDPLVDTQDRRLAYVLAHGGSGRARFLGGAEATLAPIWESLQLGVRRGEAPRVEHREVFIVFDRTGKAVWAGPFRSTTIESLRSAAVRAGAA